MHGYKRLVCIVSGTFNSYTGCGMNVKLSSLPMIVVIWGENEGRAFTARKMTPLKASDRNLLAHTSDLQDGAILPASSISCGEDEAEALSGSNLTPSETCWSTPEYVHDSATCSSGFVTCPGVLGSLNAQPSLVRRRTFSDSARTLSSAKLYMLLCQQGKIRVCEGLGVTSMSVEDCNTDTGLWFMTRLFTLKITEDEVQNLLDHRDSPYIRAVRFTSAIPLPVSSAWVSSSGGSMGLLG
jgi:hypothetical protein